MSTESESEETQPQVKAAESELGLDLDLHFLPAWAQKAPAENQYADYKGGDEGDFRGRDRRGRGPNREGGPRRERNDCGPRPGGRPGGPPRGPGAPGGGGFQNRDRRDDRFQRGHGQGSWRGGPPDRGPQREQIKLPDIDVTFIPEDKGVESLARQIKLTGRAYPLFEIAYLVLKKPERYHVQLTSKKKPDGQPIQAIYLCGLDDTIWLDENEAMNHVLDKHFSTFYATEKTPTDPPKGTYTFVAQCGISGTILGPPNYHDYQNKLRKLHQERFPRMPFDTFKSRIKIVKDEAVVKKWLEEQSFRTEFICLNIPETIRLNSREDVEKHFRETHLPNVIKPVDSYTLAGTSVHAIQNRPIHALIRRSFDEQMRFPLKVVNILSGQFARQGLQFFKVNKTVTHVAVARPHYLDMEATPVSDGVRKIVEFINSHPRSTRKQLLEGLLPGASIALHQPAAPAPRTEPPPAEGQPAEAAPPAPSAGAESSPEVSALVGDLHWLVHQGHVIEFANGILETAKKPIPRPPRPQPAGKAAAAEPPAEAETAAQDGVVEGTGTGAETASDAPSEVHSEETTTVQDESGATAGAEVPGDQQFPVSEVHSSQTSEEKQEQPNPNPS